MSFACVTVTACKRLCALQGGIHSAVIQAYVAWIPAFAGTTNVVISFKRTINQEKSDVDTAPISPHDPP
jgi:hypothetical protein